MHPSRRMLNGVMLILVLAWAIAAVVLLIGTLSAADSIQGDVAGIRTALAGSNQDLDAVRLTHRTVKLARGISRAAAPLSGQLRAEIRATAGIRSHARSIERKVFVIHGKVGAIDAHVTSIDARVRSILGNVVEIHGAVLGITNDATAILAHVSSTYAAVLGVNARFRDERATVGSIDRGARGINARADRAIHIVAPIYSRLAAVLDQVGRNHGTPLDAPIRGHADSIDCRVRGSDCGK